MRWIILVGLWNLYVWNLSKLSFNYTIRFNREDGGMIFNASWGNGFTPIFKLINLSSFSRCSRGDREVSFKQTADEKPINLPSSWNHGGNTGVKLANTIKGVDPFERDAATMGPRLFPNGLPKLHASPTRVASSNSGNAHSWNTSRSFARK